MSSSVSVILGAMMIVQQTWAQSPSPILTPSAVPSQNPAAAPPAKPAPTGTTPSKETAPSQQVDLRPKFQTGQVIKYVFDQTSHNSLKSGDASDTSLDQDQKQTERIGLTFKVVQAGDDGATIQVVYDSIKVTLTTPDGDAVYDSTQPAVKKPTPTTPTTPPATTPSVPSRTPRTPQSARPATRPAPASTPATPAPTSADPLKDLGDTDMSGMLAQIVGPMVGATITVKTDRTGAITSVSGGEALGGGGLGGGGGGGLGGLGAAGGGVVPSPSAMANWLVAGMGGKTSARVGESWTNNDSLAGTPVGSFSMKTTHTLKSASGGVANVAFVGGVEPSSQAPQGPGGAAQVQSASYIGTYAWDTSAGSLREMAADMRVSLDGGVSGIKLRMASETQVKFHRQ